MRFTQLITEFLKQSDAVDSFYAYLRLKTAQKVLNGSSSVRKSIEFNIKNDSTSLIISIFLKRNTVKTIPGLVVLCLRGQRGCGRPLLLFQRLMRIFICNETSY